MEYRYKSNFLTDVLVGLMLVSIFSAELYGQNETYSVSGILLTLLLPGHFLLISRFPNKSRDTVVSFYEDSGRNPVSMERAILAIILSASTSSASIFIASYYLPFEIQNSTVIAVQNLLLILLAIVRTIPIPEDQRYSWELSVVFPSRTNSSNRELLLLSSLAIIFIYALSIFAPVFSSVGGDEEYSEFYILGSDFEASNYPSELDVGVPFTTFIGINNHESTNAQYDLQVTHLRYDNNPSNINSQSPEFSSIEYSQQFSLENLETTTFEYSNIFEQPGSWVIKFELFKNDLSTNDPNPYRTLQLNVAVG